MPRADGPSSCIWPARNVNPAMFENVGPDNGFDTMDDWLQGDGLMAYLGELSRENTVPKLILYNLNRRDNETTASDQQRLVFSKTAAHRAEFSLNLAVGSLTGKKAWRCSVERPVRHRTTVTLRRHAH